MLVMIAIAFRKVRRSCLVVEVSPFLMSACPYVDRCARGLFFITKLQGIVIALVVQVLAII